MTAQLTVIGGGPAGLAAAAAAGEAGVATLLVDENECLGGQYFRQPRAEAVGSIADRSVRQGAAAIAVLGERGVRAMPASTAYAVAPGQVELDRGGSQETLSSALLLAPGATERVVPLPGWTLPGVVTCGAAQALLKMHGEPVGRRVLVAGSGPFLLPVAAALARAGADLVAVLEAQRLGRGAVAVACSSPDVLREAASHLWALAAARVRLRTGRAVIAIRERAGGLRVEIGRLDPQGAPLPGETDSVDCDAVCLSDGFIPSVELAELAGARLSFRPRSRTWGVAVDPGTGATSAPQVWAAGACADPWAGARLSSASGAAAGRAAAGELGARAQASSGAGAAPARSLPQRLDRAYPTRPAWYQRTGDEVIVCRCEDVDAGTIREAARESPDVNAVKRATRAGMGLCQGRTCQAAVAELTCAAGGRTLEGVGRFTARSPLRPTKLTTLGAARPPEPG